MSWQPGNRFYLDTNLFIYAVEEIAPYAEQIRPLLQAADRGEIELVTSLLTLAETLVMPYRKKDDALAAVYWELFSSPPRGLFVAQLDLAILEQAARLRATLDSVRLPDAIHLATAEAEQCDFFLTNDKRLKIALDLPILVLSDPG